MTPIPTQSARCIHLGQVEEMRRVRTLLSAVQLPVRGCQKHQKCTETQRVAGVPGCCRPIGESPCPDFQVDTFRHVAPVGTGDVLRKWEGRADRKPWDYAITVAIPHLEAPELLAAVVALHRLQTHRPYFVVVDTGSTPATCADLERMRSDDLEIHYIRSHSYPHSSAPVTAAMDVAFATCHSKYMFCTHSDVFPRRRDFLAWLLAQCGEHSPAVGWEMSPRVGNDYWRGTLSHTATMLHMPTMYTIGASWSMDRWYVFNPHLPSSHNGWPDTESGLEHCFREWGVKKIILGEETNYERQQTEWWDHARSITSLRLYASQSALASSAELYACDALVDAVRRAETWRIHDSNIRRDNPLQLPL